MKQISRFFALCLFLALSACADCAGTMPYPMIAFSPPPEPQIEMKPQLEDPLHEAWRGGYWMYDGRDFSWVPGEVILKPSPTAVWAQDRWESRGFGWAFVPGYWQ